MALFMLQEKIQCSNYGIIPYNIKVTIDFILPGLLNWGWQIDYGNLPNT